jgi:hypothetical protein
MTMAEEHIVVPAEQLGEGAGAGVVAKDASAILGLAVEVNGGAITVATADLTLESRVGDWVGPAYSFGPDGGFQVSK